MHTTLETWLLQFARYVALATMLAMAAQTAASGQQRVYSSGQTVAPAFEGWEQNPDGSFNMVFGYFNRNLDEHLHVPVGTDNNIEPGGPDMGQPTYFFPRRNRFHFKVRVPPDFGQVRLNHDGSTRDLLTVLGGKTPGT